MRYDVSVIGLYILDVLGRPVTRIPERGNVDFIEEIRLTVAGTAGGTVVDTAKLGLKSLAVGAVGDDEKADWVLLTLAKARHRYLGDAAASPACRPRRRSSMCGPMATVRRCMCAGRRTISTSRPPLYDQVFDAPIVHLGGTGLLQDGSTGRPA